MDTAHNYRHTQLSRGRHDRLGDYSQNADSRRLFVQGAPRRGHEARFASPSTSRSASPRFSSNAPPKYPMTDPSAYSPGGVSYGEHNIPSAAPSWGRSSAARSSSPRSAYREANGRPLATRPLDVPISRIPWTRGPTRWGWDDWRRFDAVFREGLVTDRTHATRPKTSDP